MKQTAACAISATLLFGLGPLRPCFLVVCLVAENVDWAVSDHCFAFDQAGITHS